jgi:hypothetical protein
MLCPAHFMYLIQNFFLLALLDVTTLHSKLELKHFFHLIISKFNPSSYWLAQFEFHERNPPKRCPCLVSV